MKKLKSDGIILDRLSELPDSLILEILSLLEMRDVVKTTLVSKRWKDLWVTIPCLKFSELGRDFVYHTVRLWRGFHVREFSISLYGESEASFSMDMDFWVQFATERKVEDLCIQLYTAGQLCPPQCLYECSSLRKLSLYDCNLQIRGNVKWDCLNSLKLCDCVFSEDVMNQVFSSSPQLEDLMIRYVRRFQNLSIRSSSLKKLSIECLDDSPSVLTIWAPNLQVLTYSGTPYVECLLTDISSLTKARLDFSQRSRNEPLDYFSQRSWNDVAVKEALSQILPAIQHVVSVELSHSCFKVLRHIKANYSISPLVNVKQLTINCWWIELRDIVGLLQCFPKLKILILNWQSLDEQFKFDVENCTESEANILKSNLLQLRTVVLTTRYEYKPSFIKFAGFLLKHATMIEKMMIRRKGVINSDIMFEAATKNLKSLLRPLPGVELIYC